jgi:hypothetical protein
MKRKAVIRPAGDGGYFIFTPYDALYVSMLKAGLHPQMRGWDPEKKAWWIAPDAIEQAIDIARQFFSLSFDNATPTAISAESSAIDSLYLLPGAPERVVKAAYRELSKLHHPDVGGDDATMKRVNAAFERLMKGQK